MIWVALWAAALITALVVIFRGHLGLFLLWVLGLVGFIASAFLQDPLLEHQAFRNFVEGASRVGWAVLITAGTVLVADLSAMIVYTVRYGKSDNQKGKTIIENRPLGSMSFDSPPLTGRSKLKMLGSKSGYITMASLVDGTATFSERMMVAGILTSMVSFFLIFVGAGLMAMKTLLILGLIPVIPGLWLYRIVRDVVQDYRSEKERVAARGLGERTDRNAQNDSPEEPGKRGNRSRPFRRGSRWSE